MEKHNYYCLAIAINVTTLMLYSSAADPVTLYKQGEFGSANHAFYQQYQTPLCQMAQCEAAEALRTGNQQRFAFAQQLFVISDKNYKEGDKKKLVLFSGEGLGDTIQFGLYLAEFNKRRAEQGLPPATLHLNGFQRLIKPMLERSIPGISITTGELKVDENTTVHPFIAAVLPDKLFNPDKETYLVPKPEAIAYWKELLKKDRLNVATAWRSGDKPVNGGKMLYRDLPFKELIDIALAVDPNAHIFVVQGPPHHNVVTQSQYDLMNEADKIKNKLNVIPDHYLKYVTQISDANGNEKFGAFEDTLALLSQTIYIGCDTVFDHMAANVAGGQAIMIVPKENPDGTTNIHFSWPNQTDAATAAKEGETTVCYSRDKVVLIQRDNKNPAPSSALAVAQLKTLHEARRC